MLPRVVNKICYRRKHACFHSSSQSPRFAAAPSASLGASQCCRKLQHFLLESSAADLSVQSLTTELISAGHKTSRMAYLKTLAETFTRPRFEDGPRPVPVCGMKSFKVVDSESEFFED